MISSTQTVGPSAMPILLPAVSVITPIQPPRRNATSPHQPPNMQSPNIVSTVLLPKKLGCTKSRPWRASSCRPGRSCGTNGSACTRGPGPFPPHGEVLYQRPAHSPHRRQPALHHWPCKALAARSTKPTWTWSSLQHRPRRIRLWSLQSILIWPLAYEFTNNKFYDCYKLFSDG